MYDYALYVGGSFVASAFFPKVQDAIRAAFAMRHKNPGTLTEVTIVKNSTGESIENETVDTLHRALFG